MVAMNLIDVRLRRPFPIDLRSDALLYVFSI